MRLFTASLTTETNTFSPIPTDRAAFEQFGIFYGDASLRGEESSIGQILAQWRLLADRDGHEIVESLAAHAQPGGRTAASVYQDFRDRILGDLRDALPVDVVLFNLHGAMAAEGVDDCEGDLLAATRALVGPHVVIAAELDLHCHASDAMFTAANLLVTYKHYPHIDYCDRATEVYRLAIAARQGAVRPVTTVVDLRMIGLWHTTREPMTSFVARLMSIEGSMDDVLSISLAHGFPWGDVASLGARLWIITDKRPDIGEAIGKALAEEFWAMRSAVAPDYVDVEIALDAVDATREGPLILADIADNPGGGAPGDSSFILDAARRRDLRGMAFGCFWSPETVASAARAGEGQPVVFAIGGRYAAISGPRLELTGTVRRLLANHRQAGLAGRWTALGATAWIEVEGNDLIFSTNRVQTMTTDIFTGLGIDLAARTAIVVKSTQHFFASFGPIGRQTLYVATPGCLAPEFAAIPYRTMTTPFWPRVDAPFDGDRTVRSFHLEEDRLP